MGYVLRGFYHVDGEIKSDEKIVSAKDIKGGIVAEFMSSDKYEQVVIEPLLKKVTDENRHDEIDFGVMGNELI